MRLADFCNIFEDQLQMKSRFIIIINQLYVSYNNSCLRSSNSEDTRICKLSVDQQNTCRQISISSTFIKMLTFWNLSFVLQELKRPRQKLILYTSSTVRFQHPQLFCTFQFRCFTRMFFKFITNAKSKPRIQKEFHL